jgi:hypothetical protein
VGFLALQSKHICTITARPCEVDLVGRRRAADLGREKGIVAVTLFSGLALRRRKTEFLSLKAWNAMAAALLCFAFAREARRISAGEGRNGGGPRTGRETRVYIYSESKCRCSRIFAPTQFFFNETQ